MTAAAGIFFSCKKQYTLAAVGSAPSGVAYLKIVHASPNFAKISGHADGLNIYLDTTKVNGPVLKFNSAYPAIGSVNTYAAVSPGSHTINIVVGGTVNADSIPIYSFQRTLVAGSYYTLLITDSLQSAHDSAKVWAQDNIPSPTAGNIGLRFVNMVLDARATDTMNLYSKRRSQILFPGVLRDSITPFSTFPTLTTLDSFYVKLANAPKDSTAASLFLTTTLVDQKVYTLYYIGDTTSVAARKRTLIYVQNK